MSDNVLGMNGSGAVDTGDGADGEENFARNPEQTGGQQNSSQRYKKQMLRSNVLLVVLFVGGVGVVYGLSLRKGPEKASAEQQGVESRVNSAILRISNEEAAQMGVSTSGHGTSSVLKSFYDKITKCQIPLHKLRKNPFVFNRRITRKPDKSAKKPDKTPAAVAKKQEDDSQEKAMAILKTLQLQSVMRGRNGGTAIISDNLLTVGQEIEGFTVEKIQAKSVILIWRDKKFVLEMP